MAHLKLLLLLLLLCITVSTGVDLHKRIYGGHKCPDTERLYHVKLMATNETHVSLCGGSLILERWILTAAHCWKNEPGWEIVVVGEGGVKSSLVWGVEGGVVGEVFDGGDGSMEGGEGDSGGGVIYNNMIYGVISSGFHSGLQALNIQDRANKERPSTQKTALPRPTR
ncbi:serine protease 30-like [Pelmatolapia mariae]|uniref:serine protease 30-like n=1 Tax=Pelmatolapia mariae TaxID=158779 RepID=UPI003211DA49